MRDMQKYDKSKLYDAIIIGGGPAGLTAALYLARAKYRVLVLEKEQFGGQITITHEVVNYPGIIKTSGKELTEAIKQQAESFGSEFLIAKANGFDLNGDIKTVKTDKGDYFCLGILIATGAHPRVVGFKGEEEYKGRGVAYCATCDGEFFTDKEIFVIGGGYAAAEESVFLTKFARHVTVLIRKDDFSCAKAVADGAKNHPKITVLTNTVVEEASGEGGLNYIRYKNTRTGEITEYRAEKGETFGIFVFAGYTPETELVNGIVELDEKGYIITDKSQRTSVSGLYAAGDVCIKPLRQVVTATADGAIAATELEKEIAEIQRKTGIFAESPTPKKQLKADETAIIPDTKQSDGIFAPEIKEQLKSLFEKMQNDIAFKLYLDSRPVSAELKEYIEAIASLSDKLSVSVANSEAPSDVAPCVKLCLSDGTETGLSFHGVPGGHEFTSFVLGIYNASGPGQTIDEATMQLIRAIEKPTDIKVLVSLSCIMCPDAVIAAQQIAANNPNVKAEIYDVHHFEKLRSRYNVMSVPCIVINENNVSFGKKNIKQIIDMIG